MKESTDICVKMWGVKVKSFLKNKCSSKIQIYNKFELCYFQPLVVKNIFIVEIFHFNKWKCFLNLHLP